MKVGCKCCAMLSLVLALTAAVCQVCVASNSSPPSDGLHHIRLLAIVPFPDSRPSSGWDDGLQVLPAARLAVKHINSLPNLLPGYKLELIEANSDGCGVKTVSGALVSFAREAVAAGNATNVVGIVGLACSSVATVISPLAGREEISLIQLSMGNSPVFRNHNRYPRLWRVLPSSVAFVDSVMAIMDKFNRTKVSVVHDEGIYFATTANEFIKKAADKNVNVTMERVLREPEAELSAARRTAKSRRQVNELLTESTKDSFARIIFASVTRQQAALLLCRAYKLKLVWPGFLWVFHTRTVHDIISNVNKTNCTASELYRAMNNTINMDFQFEPSDYEKNLSSQITYKQYTHEYAAELDKLRTEERYSQYMVDRVVYENSSVWANVMYDEVWAFGSALNKSLVELKQQNLSLQDFHIGNSYITDIIQRQFQTVSFDGTMGQVSFDNKTHEGQTPIIIHVNRCTETDCEAINIGEFSPKINTVLLRNFSSENIPEDEFKMRVTLLQIWEFVLLLLVICTVFLLITYNLIIVMLNWNTREIKATSPALSMLIFIGCYILCVVSLLRLVAISIDSCETVLLVMCNLEPFLFTIGVNLVLGTVVVKLARIFRIFSTFSEMGNVWLTKYLFIAVLVIVVVGSIPSVLWVSIDHRKVDEMQNYDYGGNPPLIVVTRTCVSEHFYYWLASLIAIPAIQLLFMVFFAYETRNARIKSFKDTKKVLFYVFFSVLSFGFFIITFIAFFAVSAPKGTVAPTDIILIFLFLLFPINAQVFLYIPKTVPLMFKKRAIFKISTFRDSNPTIKAFVSYF